MNIHVFRCLAGALLLVFGISASAAIHPRADNLPYSPEGAEFSSSIADSGDATSAARKRCIAWVPAYIVNGQLIPRYCALWASFTVFDEEVTASFQRANVDGNDNAPHSHQAAPDFSTEDVAAKKRCVAWVPAQIIGGQLFPRFCAIWASLGPVGNGLSYLLPDIEGGNLDSVELSAAKQCVAWVPSGTVNGQYYPGFCAKWASVHVPESLSEVTIAAAPVCALVRIGGQYIKVCK
jgi:hypothetical protein